LNALGNHFEDVLETLNDEWEDLPICQNLELKLKKINKNLKYFNKNILDTKKSKKLTYFFR